MNNDKDSAPIQQQHILQGFKMSWLAAEAAGDRQTQLALIRDLSNRPDQQSALIDFIAAYYASNDYKDEPLLPMTQRANATALERVLPAPTPVAQGALSGELPVRQQATVATLGELRKARQLTKQATARGLRLSTDVWEQFERGAIELASLSQRQLERLAQFFQVSAEQFSTLLNASTPTFVLNRRQTREGAQQEQQNEQNEQGQSQKQSFKRVVSRSTMSADDKKFWLS